MRYLLAGLYQFVIKTASRYFLLELRNAIKSMAFAKNL
jgi:hypothetical protein